MKDLSVRKTILALTLAFISAGPVALAAQPVAHQIITVPGGTPGTPVMTGIEHLTNGIGLTWDGPAGYYQVFQKSNSLTAPWAALGKNTNLTRSATITKLYSNAFFRVSGPAPKYAGLKTCLTCHAGICSYVTNTPHATAFSNPIFKAAGGQTNSSCLACHTVGYGLPTGFSFTNKLGTISYTTNLANVQCENCHGPAANHAASPDDPTVIPRVDIAATICGGCHTGPMSPTYEEWNSSGHAVVVPDALASMTSSTNSIKNCGACHSGTARLALIGGKNPALTMTNDFNVPLTCAVCHDPHATNANPVQLRNPMASTNDYHLTSASLATVSAFTNQYNANADINLCGQCHNDRGAAWTDTARAPHHSLQYNMLLGSVGQMYNGITNVPATFSPGPHSGLPADAANSISGTFYLTNQCASCHMEKDAPPASTHSHTFTPAYQVCLNCHDGAAAQDFFTPYLSNQVSTVIFALNRWAALEADPSLITNGVVAWEYTSPGGLVWQTNSLGYVTGWSQEESVSFKGPNAAGQALIPNRIKQARFNLYLVVNDGSGGVHNPFYALNLLYSAQSFVLQELNQ
ncbi:MAG TPA: multiheme c-type cytochrome [bacterium]|nr:multiheme c-type cytochrome [bacterium]